MRRKMTCTVVMALVAAVATAGVTAAKSLSQLKEDVRGELDRYYITPFTVTVTRDGSVTLEGDVNSYWDKVKVYEAVSRVDGVTAISNQLVVNADQMADKAIESSIEYWIGLTDAIKDADDINVTVSDGVVVLSGTVSFYRESQMAETIAAWASGVTGVVNEIRVLPPETAMSDRNLSEVARDVLDRFFPRNRSKITVRVSDGKAILGGTVDQVWVKKAVEDEISRVRGIRQVDNNITVKL